MYYVSEAYGLVCDGCGARVVSRMQHDAHHADIEALKRHLEEANHREAVEAENLQEYGREPVHCDESCPCRSSS